MSGSWAPSKLGKLITGTPEWALALEGEQFKLTVEGKSLRDSVLLLSDLEIKTGLIWATLRLTLNKGQWRTLDGIPNRKARELHKAVHHSVEGIQYRAHVAGLIQGFKAFQETLLVWATEALGFPSRVADDPVLQLAMPGGDAFEFAEERRLFYVALTRARSTVTLVTVTHKESPFITELIKDHAVGVFNADGTASSDQLCPTCGEGFLMLRKSKFGPFMGCSSYPNCKHKYNL